MPADSEAPIRATVTAGHTEGCAGSAGPADTTGPAVAEQPSTGAAGSAVRAGLKG
ncbi:Uncharacterised protein [Mycobacterium tuberculosis]|nr:Uncharacterised protein [Mycobacterium tuberculosis]